MKKKQAQKQGTEGNLLGGLLAEKIGGSGESGSARNQAEKGALPVSAPGTKGVLETESSKESMEMKNFSKSRSSQMPAPPEPDSEQTPTESLSVDGLEPLIPPKGGSGDVTRDDTEEVFVILPEENESGQLPVVETVVVENQPWETGSTGLVTTDVIKGSQKEAPIEEVALKKTNPLTKPDGETEGLSHPDPTTDVIASQGLDSEKGEDELGVIDEIADIAADLHQEEPIDAGLDMASKPADESAERGGERITAKGRRLKFVAFSCSVAALVLVGVLLYPSLEKYYTRITGGGEVVSTSGEAQALGTARPGPGGGVEDPGHAGKEPGVVSRNAFRSKILLAMQVGLRAEAGKE